MAYQRLDAGSHFVEPILAVAEAADLESNAESRRGQQAQASETAASIPLITNNRMASPETTSLGFRVQHPSVVPQYFLIPRAIVKKLQVNLHQFSQAPMMRRIDCQPGVFSRDHCMNCSG
jgi:hypothetical protein